MTKVLVAALIAISLFGCSPRPNGYNASVCGTEAAIVGGSAFPGDTPTIIMSACSGVLVAPNIILSAKHCPSMDRGWESYDHPTADLRAYIVTEPILDRPYATIGEPALGEARIEGYGLNEDGGMSLRKAATVYIDEIEDAWLYTSPVDGNACSGDSGGPLYIDGEVVGLISVAYGGGEGYEVAGYEDEIDCSGRTGYVNLSGHMPWITAVMEGTPLPPVEVLAQGC
jgi:hypothetical protein